VSIGPCRSRLRACTPGHSGQYRRLDEARPGRYAYHHGLVAVRFFSPVRHGAMAGGTEAHAQIILRMLVALGSHLAGGPCCVYPSDMKLAAGANDYSSDAFVVCSEPMLPNRRVVNDAVLVCAVRSESTAAFDVGETFTA
jgi:Uma2 family endonuclease